MSSASSTCSRASELELAELHYFSSNDDDHRYLRLRCGMLCAAFNAQSLSVSKEERERAWYDIVDPYVRDSGVLPEAPMIKSPIYIDYGVNLHVAPSCFVNRNCVFIDSPICPIAVGENTIIGPGVQIHSVTHPVDWRERDGRKGPSLTGPVTIGKDCFIGSYAVILPGTIIGDGCVISPASVVADPIPAYHVAVGNPAMPIRKVSCDAPDAPSLNYEQDDKFVVREPGCTRDARTPTPVNDGSSKDQVLEAERQLRDVLEETSVVSSRHILVDVAMLVLAMLLFWVIVHGALY